MRRDLLTEYPVLAQAGAPSTDANALIPIHAGAATYYNGEEQSFVDKYSDKIYYGLVLLGALGSAVVAAWRFAGFGTPPTNLVEQLYELGHEIQTAKSEPELDAIEQKIDGYLKAALAGSAGADTAALNLAAHRLQYLMKYRRTVLRQSPSPTLQARIHS